MTTAPSRFAQARPVVAFSGVADTLAELVGMRRATDEAHVRVMELREKQYAKNKGLDRNDVDQAVLRNA